MAKRKGKSKSRIKGWAGRFHAGETEPDDHARRQRLSKRGIKIPERDLDVGQESLDDLPRCQGMVLGMFPGGVEVKTEDGILLCMVAKAFQPPQGATALTVGDIVTIALTPRELTDAAGLDKDRCDGMIINRAPRKTVLARPQPRSSKRTDQYNTEIFEKVTVANMDTLLIMSAVKHPPLKIKLIDRYLIIAQRGNMDAVVVITKIDLEKPDKQTLDEFEHRGLKAFQVSSVTGQGVDELKNFLTKRKSVLAGASGIGKSTLINHILPDANITTRSLRRQDNRGRHTTTTTRIFDLPGGGKIVDTPGIRELGLKINPDDLPWFFPEFTPYAADCKFNDCTHTHEPGCAIIKAAEEGKILLRRFESYLRLRETLEENF